MITLRKFNLLSNYIYFFKVYNDLAFIYIDIFIISKLFRILILIILIHLMKLIKKLTTLKYHGKEYTTNLSKWRQKKTLLTLKCAGTVKSAKPAQ